jgi:hypothetical protein
LSRDSGRGIDVYKIGFKHFKVDMWLKEPAKRKKIWGHLKYNQYVTYLNTSAGYADIEIELVIESIDALLLIIEDITKKIPPHNKKIHLFYGTGRHGISMHSRNKCGRF